MTEESSGRAGRRSASQTRARLIEAAEELMVAAGDESAVSVRALSGRAGVTAPTIYRHFPDMTALLAEVAARRFAELDAAIAAAGGNEDPAQELVAFGRAFARFGLEHPDVYRVLFMNRASAAADMVARLREVSGYRYVRAGVERAITTGLLAPDEDAHEVASLMIMSLHGVVAMLIARPGPWPEAERLVERMVAAVGYGVVPRA